MTFEATEHVTLPLKLFSYGEQEAQLLQRDRATCYDHPIYQIGSLYISIHYEDTKVDTKY